MTANTWNVYGKLEPVEKDNGDEIGYQYDAGGNRMSKTVNGNNITVYVRDATGNIMAFYQQTPIIKGESGGGFKQIETDIYGSSRLGLTGETTTTATTVTLAGSYGTAVVSTIARGEKNYELTNHLGNVLVNISDKPLPVSTNGTSIAYNTADVITAQDYSSFGAVNRSFNPSGVTNAFNGQRLSPEISATAQTATYWEYNGDVGKRWNVDPRPNISFSPYATFENSPILRTDVWGDQVDSGRVKGINFIIVPNKLMRIEDIKDHKLGSAYAWETKKAKSMAKRTGTQFRVIEAGDAEDAVTQIKGALATDEYVKNLTIDFHRSSGTFNDPQYYDGSMETAFKDLSNGYIGKGSNVYLGMCWAAGQTRLIK